MNYNTDTTDSTDYLPDELLMAHGLISEALCLDTDEDEKRNKELKALDLLDLYGAKMRGEKIYEDWRRKYEALARKTMNGEFDDKARAERIKEFQELLKNC